MAKKKAVRVPEPKIFHGSEIIFEEGKFRWQVALGTPGNYTTGWATGKYRATFKNDPDGFRGHGNTKDQAEQMLLKYAFGNFSEPDLEL